MRPQHLQLIREACIKANPEIVELTQGCFVKDFLQGTLEILAKYEIKGETPVYDYVFRGEDEVSVARSPRGNWDILGRPIRLADVLLASLTKWRVTPEFKAEPKMWLEFVAALCNGRSEVVPQAWNLRNDDLIQQSDETLSFLANLLS